VVLIHTRALVAGVLREHHFEWAKGADSPHSTFWLTVQNRPFVPFGGLRSDD